MNKTIHINKHGNTYINKQPVGGIVEHRVPVKLRELLTSLLHQLQHPGVHTEVARDHLVVVVAQHGELVLAAGVRVHPYTYLLGVHRAHHTEAEENALEDWRGGRGNRSKYGELSYQS